MKDEVVLHIREDTTILVEVREKGTVRTKHVDIDTLLGCLADSMGGIQIQTGILPSNIISLSFDDDSRYAVVEFPDEYADITYMSTTYKHFPLPRLLFGFHLESSGRITAVRLGVPALGKLTEKTPMFCYPFSNVNGFSLCVGTNSLPRIPALQSLQNLPGFIVSLPDNDDFFLEQHNRMGLGHRDLMEHLRDKDRQYYYDHVLVPMPGITLKNFISEVRR